ncbi:hypothetical protein Pcinc_003987 [Petrolisthes cinctipes]|uniref:RNA-directed DNA polymerase n=1 Tax=Petrolisthes cinctipes TaxID=88211 RepID=A0AAE1GHT9_PETCI|nr:hypothetical protein Pcinc_003987 [Petrolisthes cinctipes]
MLIDSGANVNLLDGNTFDQVTKQRPNIVLNQTKMKPMSYEDTTITLKGKFFATLTNGSTRIAHKILVTKARQGSNILVEQLLSEVNGAKKFSKVDLNSYYHQIKLTPESRGITTFLCDSGVYRYKVLVMGITSAVEEGQRLLQQILQKCPNCWNGADDILIWGKDIEEHDCQGVGQLKDAVLHNEALMHFHPQLQTSLIVDVSPVGLGAILCQNHQGVLKPVSYASRTLTNVERRYCQLEKEALAIEWACEKFHLYLYGKEFFIMTDNQALTIIFSPKGKPSAHVIRWILRMQQYDCKGSENPADILSRQPLKYHREVSTEEKLAEGFVNHILANNFPKAMTLSEIVEESKDDPTLRAVEEAIGTNDWANKVTEPFKHVRSELTTKRGVIVRGSRIVIPRNLQQHTLQRACETHVGMLETKALLQAKVWWPNMDKDVEEAIKRCVPCASLYPRKQANPVNMTTMKGPWEVIHIDICGPFPSGDYVIGIVDAGSRWLEAFIINSTDTRDVFAHKVFQQLLYQTMDHSSDPKKLAIFAIEWEMRHQKVTPYHPQANREVERFFSTMLKAIRAVNTEEIDWS